MPETPSSPPEQSIIDQAFAASKNQDATSSTTAAAPSTPPEKSIIDQAFSQPKPKSIIDQSLGSDVSKPTPDLPKTPPQPTVPEKPQTDSTFKTYGKLGYGMMQTVLEHGNQGTNLHDMVASEPTAPTMTGQLLQAVGRGGASFIDSLTSPLNRDMMLASFGLAALAPEVEGATGAAAVAAKYAPGLFEKAGINPAVMSPDRIMKATDFVSKLARLGISSSMVIQAMDLSPEFKKDWANHDYPAATETLFGMMSSGIMGLTAIKGEGPAVKSTITDQMAGRHQEVLWNHTQESLKFNKEMKDLVPDHKRREGLQFYAAAGKDPELLNSWKDELQASHEVNPNLKKQLLRAYNTAIDMTGTGKGKITPEEMSAHGKLMDFYKMGKDRLIEMKLLHDSKPTGQADPSDILDSIHDSQTRSADQAWVARMLWKHEDMDDPVNIAHAKLHGGETPDHLQERVFGSIHEGVMLGYEPAQNNGGWLGLLNPSRYVFDAADIASDYHNSIGRAIAKKSFADDLAGRFGSDGRPLIIPGGVVQKVKGGPSIADGNKFGDHALTKDQIETFTKLAPDGKHIADPTTGGSMLDSLVKSKAIYPTADGGYKYDSKGYVNDINSRHATNIGWAGGITQPTKADIDAFINGETADTPENQANLLRARTAFHPEIARLAKDILDPEPSAIRSYEFKHDTPIIGPILGGTHPGNMLLNTSSALKQTLLGASGFHWLQEAARASESGISPVRGLQSWDTNNVEHQKLIRAGGIQPGIQRGASYFMEGSTSGGLMENIPMLGEVLRRNNQLLFGPNGYIDKLKLTAALDFVGRIKEAYPDMPEDDRYKLAGDLANHRFGGQNYLQLGRSKTMQDLSRLFFLAPDWLESNAKDTALAMKYPEMGGKDFARIAMLNFVLAQSLNMAWGGRIRPDHPFEVVSPDGKTAYSMRTLPADLIHLGDDPRGTITNRLNPTITRTALELASKRDRQGHLRPSLSEQVEDLFNNIVPIPAQGLAQHAEGDKATPIKDAILTAAGLSTRQVHSPAEELALRYRSEGSGGNISSDKLHQVHKVNQFEDRLRGGEDAQKVIKDMEKGIDSGELPPNSIKKALKDSKEGLLVSSMKGRTMEQALDIWNKADDKERLDLLKPMINRVKSFDKKGKDNYTAEEQKALNKKIDSFLQESLKYAPHPTEEDQNNKQQSIIDKALGGGPKSIIDESLGQSSQ